MHCCFHELLCKTHAEGINTKWDKDLLSIFIDLLNLVFKHYQALTNKATYSLRRSKLGHLAYLYLLICSIVCWYLCEKSRQRKKKRVIVVLLMQDKHHYAADKDCMIKKNMRS
uniref:Ovule protein n=1 Tax=Heterorhabditis bacteriophora TaxID=37862 RepID=A0A1I7XV06_HETBA